MRTIAPLEPAAHDRAPDQSGHPDVTADFVALLRRLEQKHPERWLPIIRRLGLSSPLAEQVLTTHTERRPERLRSIRERDGRVCLAPQSDREFN